MVPFDFKNSFAQATRAREDVISGKGTPPCYSIRDPWYSQASCVSGACLACFPSAFWVLAFSSSHPMLKAAAGYHPYLWREEHQKT